MSDTPVKGQAERRCPKCFYNLQGLPEPCACPECGEKIDAGARMWRARRPSMLLLASSGPYFLLCQWIAMLVMRWTQTIWVLPITYIVWFLIAVAWTVWIIRRGVFVYVDRSGFRYRSATLRVVEVPWNLVRKIERRKYDHEVELTHTAVKRDRLTAPLAPVGWTILKTFRTTQDTVDFVDHVERLRDEAAPAKPRESNVATRGEHSLTA